ncbi:MAG: hypothetical protein ACOYOS_04320 [Syntrophales bacterium]
MYRPELLKDLLLTIQCLKKELAGPDEEKVMAAQEAYHELLEGFYEEYGDMVAPQQYELAKNDPDYFLVLIQLAFYDQEFEKVDKQGDQSLPYMNWKLFTQI